MSDLNLDYMRKAGSILAKALKFIENDFIVPGMSALDVSLKMEEIILSYEGATLAFKGYKGFPEAACVSINEQVVHGIPKADKIIADGDIVSVDCGVIYGGHYADACRTVGVGSVNARTRKLLKTTSEALDRGILAAMPGNCIGDISYAVQRHVQRNRFKVSLEFVGHGIGTVLHGPPAVPNYGPPRSGPEISVGTCLAIEPVVFDGSAEAVLENDSWTVVSKNGNLSAHFEDTIIITEKGPEITTR